MRASARSITVSPLRRELLESQNYDLLVSSLGFESRAWFVPALVGERSARKLAWGFASRRSQAYDENLRRFRHADFEIIDCDEASFPTRWERVLTELMAHRNGSLKVCLDVSSMSRVRMAHIIGSLMMRNESCGISVDLAYAVAKFSPPTTEVVPIEVCEPVTPQFTGWWTEPERPAVAIFGVGYEEEKAVGAWEYIEPARVWAFKPTGEDRRYDKALEIANRNLWGMLPESNVISYVVDKPFECFTTLEGLAYGNLKTSRLILIPFGPKIFTVCALLVACIHWPNIAVWRVSAGQNDVPVDRRASGKVIGLRAEFVRNDTTAEASITQ